MAVVARALQKGYTITLGGDTSEPGYDDLTEVAMVPTFDIPAAYIDEDARQLRWSNGTTTDDHGIHVVGIMQKANGNWYLIKDSGSGSRNGPHKGYRFYHQDYIKLKMLDMMVHKDMVEKLLEKFPNREEEKEERD
jgi:bleomycin hydrolase